MNNIKKNFMFFMFTVSLMCIMALSTYAVDITIYSKDNNGSFISGATFEVSSSSTTYQDTYVAPAQNTGIIFSFTAGTTYYINVRKNGYVSNYISFTCPSSNSTYNVSLGSKTTYTNASFVKPFTFNASPQGSDISSGIGWRYMSAIQFHTGIDIPKAANTSISSIQNGDVTGKGYDSSQLGYWIQTKTTSGTIYYARYLHMISASSYDVNDKVYTSNCTIGYVGSTGNSTGNHLHLDISTSSTVSQSTAIDPTAFYN